MQRRLQNRIAESTATLPVAAVTATLLWWLPQGGYSTAYLLGWVVCVVTTYIVVETSTQNALLRLRSRMDSALFLLVMAACGTLHALSSATATLIPLTAAIFCLLRSYDKPQPQLDTFHAYLLLSLASLFEPPLLLLTPVLMAIQVFFLRSLTWRGTGAILCGVVVPYLFWGATAMALEDIKPFTSHATAIIWPFTEPFYWQWLIEQPSIYAGQDMESGDTLLTTVGEGLRLRAMAHPQLTAMLAWLLLLSLTGVTHYLRHSYDDKIRVRMCHYTFITLLIACGLWLLLQPRYAKMLLPLIILSSVPSAAHFMALTHTRFTNYWTFFLLFLLLPIILLGILGTLIPVAFL